MSPGGFRGPIAAILLAAAARGAEIDLSRAAVVVRGGPRGPAEAMAATVLVEEAERRTGIRWEIRDDWPQDGRPAIALAIRDGASSWSDRIPRLAGSGLAETRPEGFLLRSEAGTDGRPPEVIVAGADGRGTLFGAGRLLRLLRLGPGRAVLEAPIDEASAPAYPIRGHQLGYRARANSYDAWTPEMYERYIRELVIFGANCIENIPFQDADRSPHMRVPRDEMNRRLSEICARHDLDYWVWTPADFPLEDREARRAALERHEELARTCPRLDGVFFPGGDPGDNPPSLIIPYLRDLAGPLVARHPAARIWVSLQGFDRARAEEFLAFVERESPDWLGGIVTGPSSPPIGETRRRLPPRYRLRWYPDITHTVRCQYPVERWDPAFARTLGREPVNPRPADSAAVFRLLAPGTDGFLSYSDGIHDDVNKAVWTMLAWDPRRDPRGMVLEYARFFWGAEAAGEAADGILGLEGNWRGDLASNGAVEGVLSLWRGLEERFPALREDWRFGMHLLRASYDTWTRRRLLRETALEAEANGILRRARELGADRAAGEALAVLAMAVADPVSPELRGRLEELGDRLFRSIGFQTSVARHGASGPERGAVLDFLDVPLNDRWWLEDEIGKARALAGEEERAARLEEIGAWEDPGPGGYYDEVGHPGRSPRLIRGEGFETDPEGERHDAGGHSWWDAGRSRRRLAWQHHLRWPAGLRYEALDPSARYVLRMTGQGDARPRADGTPLVPSRYSREVGGIKEFPVPPEATADGRLLVTWDDIDESGLNWRQHSHVAEVWLLKRPAEAPSSSGRRR